MALQLVELEIEFGVEVDVNDARHHVARDDGTVKRTYDVDIDSRRLGGVKRERHSVATLGKTVYAGEVLHYARQYGALAHSVDSAQYIDIFAQVPLDMMKTAP